MFCTMKQEDMNVMKNKINDNDNVKLSHKNSKVVENTKLYYSTKVMKGKSAFLVVNCVSYHDNTSSCERYHCAWCSKV